MGNYQLDEFVELTAVNLEDNTTNRFWIKRGDVNFFKEIKESESVKAEISFKWCVEKIPVAETPEELKAILHN